MSGRFFRMTTTDTSDAAEGVPNGLRLAQYKVTPSVADDG